MLSLVEVLPVCTTALYSVQYKQVNTHNKWLDLPESAVCTTVLYSVQYKQVYTLEQGR